MKDIINIVNLTPHPVSVFSAISSKIITFPKSDLPIPRLQESRGNKVVVRAFVGDGEIDAFEISNTIKGEVIDLPERVLGTFYIVSGLVLDAVPDRKDLISPDSLVRDDNGVIIGCKGFRTNVDLSGVRVIK